MSLDNAFEHALIPWTFMSSTYQLTNFSSAPATIVETDSVPPGYIGVLSDIATIFTTAGGTIAYDIVHPSGGTTRWTAGITSNNTGTSSLVIPTNAKFRITVTTAGVGVIDVFWNGHLRPYKIPEIAFRQRTPPESLASTGGI